MKIETVILGIALWMCGYYIGYAIGFKHGFRYLADKFESFRREKDDSM